MAQCPAAAATCNRDFVVPPCRYSRKWSKQKNFGNSDIYISDAVSIIFITYYYYSIYEICWNNKVILVVVEESSVVC